jgi:hypothetical protein
MHIAESVLNRIANAMEGMQPIGIAIPPPITPEPLMQGAMLDDQLMQPPGDIAVPLGLEGDAAAGAIEESVAGGSPLAGMIGATGF